MDIDLNDCSISELMVDIHWNLFNIQLIFGGLPNSPIFKMGAITPDAPSQWIWFPKSHKTKLASKVYRRLLSNYSTDEP